MVMETISIRFFRTKGNAKKLNRLALEFSLQHVPFSIDDIVIVYLSPADFARFLFLWGIVKHQKDSAVYVDDSIQTKEQAEKIIDWIRCYANRTFFAEAKDYCCISSGVKELHGWGCKYLHSITRHGNFGRHHGLPWYCVGPDEGKLQYIDKQDIKDMLSAEAEAKGLSLCPMFSIERAFRFVDQLPDQIEQSEKEIFRKAPLF